MTTELVDKRLPLRTGMATRGRPFVELTPDTTGGHPNLIDD
ncbi:hypothetical protein [Streptomyces sp. NBC_00443]